MRTVTQLTFASAITACAITTWGCSSPVRTLPAPSPSLPPSDTTARVILQVLRLSLDTFYYELTQTADIRPESSVDTARATIKTTALFSVAITSSPDSAYELIVSADSVLIAASGSAPLRSEPLPTVVGPVLRVRASNRLSQTEVLLPDSLCSHAQLISTAHEIILPALPMELTLHRDQRWADSVRFRTCPAGTVVEALTSHDIRETGTQPAEFTIHSITKLDGRGMLRGDSVIIVGSVRTQSRALMHGSARLPDLIEAQSEGAITIRLGDSTTVFRQTTTRQIRQRLPN